MRIYVAALKSGVQTTDGCEGNAAAHSSVNNARPSSCAIHAIFSHPTCACKRRFLEAGGQRLLHCATPMHHEGRHSYRWPSSRRDVSCHRSLQATRRRTSTRRSTLRTLSCTMATPPRKPSTMRVREVLRQSSACIRVPMAPAISTSQGARVVAVTVLRLPSPTRLVDFAAFHLSCAWCATLAGHSPRGRHGVRHGREEQGRTHGGHEVHASVGTLGGACHVNGRWSNLAACVSGILLQARVRDAKVARLCVASQ